MIRMLHTDFASLRFMVEGTTLLVFHGASECNVLLLIRCTNMQHVNQCDCEIPFGIATLVLHKLYSKHGFAFLLKFSYLVV